MAVASVQMAIMLQDMFTIMVEQFYKMASLYREAILT